MKYILLVLFSITCLSQFKLYSQTRNDSLKTKQIKHSIGAAAGFSTGYGLSYLGSLNKYKLQVTFFPYSDKVNYWAGRITQYSTGLTFYYVLDQHKYIGMFLYQGNHLWYDRRTGNRPYLDIINIHSLGFGLDVTPSKNLSVHLMGGYALYSNHGTYGNYGVLNMTAETGLFYNF
jgi:hypothetical protein